MTQKRRKADSGKAIGETTALRWEPTHVTKPNPRVVPLQLPVDLVTNFIWPYLHQFFDDSHSLNGYRKPLKRPLYQYQSRLEAISDS